MPFLPEKIKIDKTQKLVCNLRDKKKYVVHTSIFKQALNHGLKLKKVHRIIEFNQEAWLKKYIDMNTELRKKASNDFEKDFFKLMNNAVFGKTMENVRKHRDITQPAHNVPGTSPEGPLKVLTSGTSRGPSGDSQVTNTKIDDLMKKLSF